MEGTECSMRLYAAFGMRRGMDKFHYPAWAQLIS